MGKSQIALIGYTGMIGKTILHNLNSYIDCYNSSNIEELKNQSYNEIYFAGLTGNRRHVNEFPQIDLQTIMNIFDILRTVKCRKMYMISTIDAVHFSNLYGHNRKVAEEIFKRLPFDVQIYRIPTLFGSYIKKGLMYDLMINHLYSPIKLEDSFQWYFADQLYDDIQRYKHTNVQLIELYSEPMTIKFLIDKIYERTEINLMPSIEHITNNTTSIAYNYLCSQLSCGYEFSRDLIITQMECFIKQHYNK